MLLILLRLLTLVIFSVTGESLLPVVLFFERRLNTFIYHLFIRIFGIYDRKNNNFNRLWLL